MLSRPVAPLGPVHHGTAEVSDVVEGEGQPRRRLRQAGNVDRGDRGGPRGDHCRRGGCVVCVVLGEMGRVVLLEDERRVGLDVGALIHVREMDRGVEFGEFKLKEWLSVAAQSGKA